MTRTSPIELTNMIMIENSKTHEILVENRKNRKNPNWPGVTFPGGHIESGETVVASAIREAYEETGLMIENPQLVGIKEWPLTDGARYIVMLFKATQYHGTLQSGQEGDIFWTTRDELRHMDTPRTFLDMLPVFDELEINELALSDIYQGERTMTFL
ncbi:8-oxo-dGTP diphosphatase [Leuconostoc gasicomitatum]|uniref:8-oxo-dGTP diphosphatase n=1 Tax=Leuconostoc gasicomitatum TaxID=115778 RepID=UPI001CC76478|nr:8-oxo-dGTP diphosphatase [Leuconostoc gasicomitatum]MBZ5970365.1 8-oxo-dGTP diphosphatase [Leuconostoc gasicomitatum]MBZ5998029.1 8-oxo-dGTP diphosphatase [Leuconostoc gasicomitatum]